MSKHFSPFDKKREKKPEKPHLNKWGVVKESKTYLKGPKEKPDREQPAEGQTVEEVRQRPITGGQSPEEWIRKTPLYLPHGVGDRGKVWAERMPPSDKAQMLKEHYPQLANYDLETLVRMVKDNHPAVRLRLEGLRKRWVDGELLR